MAKKKKTRRKNSVRKKSASKPRVSAVDKLIDQYIEEKGKFPTKRQVAIFEKSVAAKKGRKKTSKRSKRRVSQKPSGKFTQRTMRKNLTKLEVVQRVVRFKTAIILTDSSDLSRMKSRLLKRLLPHTKKFFSDFVGKETDIFQYIILTSLFTNVRGEKNAQGVSGIRTEITTEKGNEFYTESIIDYLLSQSEVYLTRFVKRIRITGLRMEVIAA